MNLAHPIVLFTAILFTATMFTACTSPEPNVTVPSAEVLTASGVVVPLRSPEGALRWLDIPYAQAPTGERRWRAPQPLAASSGVIGRQPEGMMCPQPESQTSGLAGEGFAGTEDCLYLDVVAPERRSGEPLPVMFWIHGGGNTTGHKGTYDFSALAARESVVVVSINYRLGPLGWFAHPALQEGVDRASASGNFGTLDIITALRWTQDNIANFGGDPDRVTVFGESAGGRNVYSLLASPLSDGLFAGAIIQSGHLRSLTLEQAFNRDRRFDHIDRGGWEVTRALDLPPADATAQALRAVDAEQLLKTYYGLPEDHIQPAIFTDGHVLPEVPLEDALADPRYAKHIPVMAGSNRDEVTLWLGTNRYFVEASYPLTKWGPPHVRLRDKALYDFWISVRSRAWKARGVDQPLTALVEAGYSSLYAYRFDWDEQDDNWFLPFSEILGAAHASEIAFIMGAPFYGPIADYMYPDTPSAAQMTDTMMSAWGRFARTGSPGQVDGTPWPAWQPDDAPFMVLDAGAQSSHRAKNPATMDALLAEIAASGLLNPRERCILVWETVTAVGQPDYEAYSDWNNGECAAFDAPAAKEAVRAKLVEEHGSATVI